MLDVAVHVGDGHVSVGDHGPAGIKYQPSYAACSNLCLAAASQGQHQDENTPRVQEILSGDHAASLEHGFSPEKQSFARFLTDSWCPSGCQITAIKGWNNYTDAAISTDGSL
jgi:hypothetical protein